VIFNINVFKKVNIMKKNLLFLMVLAASLLFSAGGFASGLNGDFDHDGDVDGEDLTVFSENFGTTAGRCTENSNCESDLYCAKEMGDCDDCLPACVP